MGEVINELLGGQLQAFAAEVVLAVLVELGSGAIERDQNVLARRVAGLLDGLQDQLDGFGMAAEVRREAAFVADGGGETLLVEQFLQGVEDFGATAQRFAEGRQTDRHDHEFLDVQAVVGVLATVDDVHHRHRHLHRARTAEVAIKRQTGFLGGALATAIDTASMALAPRRDLLSVPSRSIRSCR